MQRAFEALRRWRNRPISRHGIRTVVREAMIWPRPRPVRGSMTSSPGAMAFGSNPEIRSMLGSRPRPHDNCYFPLFIRSPYRQGAQHVEGFARTNGGGYAPPPEDDRGKLQPDPKQLEEPLIVRSRHRKPLWRCVLALDRSHRDLPLLINQWANVVRWEMRTRLFLRTSESSGRQATRRMPMPTTQMAETLRDAGSPIASFRRTSWRCRLIAGEKSSERTVFRVPTTLFDRSDDAGCKALAGRTSHYLGTHFSRHKIFAYQNDAGELSYCHTTSWGVSTRLIGGVVMSGDDDGVAAAARDCNRANRSGAHAARASRKIPTF